MKFIKSTGLILAGLISVGGSVQAADFSYNYIDAGLRLADRNGFDATGVGAEISMEIQPRLRVRAFYQFLDGDDVDGELEDLGGSIGYYTQIDPKTHIVLDAGLMYEYIEVGPFDDDDTGIKLDATLRHQVDDKLELNAGVNYVDIFDDDDIGVLFAGLYRIAPNAFAEVRYETIFETDIMSFGARVLF